MTQHELDALQGLCDNDEPTSATVIVMLTAFPGLIAEVRRLTDELDVAYEQRDEYKARLDAEAAGIEQMLRILPVSICKKFCVNSSPHCAGWCECIPKWRGPQPTKEDK